MDDGAARAQLIAAALDGAFETPPWAGFLARLRQATGAEFATFMLRPPGRPYGEALGLFSGVTPQEEADNVYRQHDSALTMLSDFGMDEGRIYSFGELYPPTQPEHLAFFENVVIANGIDVCRMVRLMEPAGVSGWLAISRRDGIDFGAGADAILAAVVPILRGALRFFVALERERFTAKVTGDAMRRLHFGWIALDAGGLVVEHDAEAERVFAHSGVLGKRPNGQLMVQPPPLRQKIFEAIETLAANPKERARAFILSPDPWLDVLLMSAGHNRLSAHPRAAVIAYFHGDSWQTTDRCEQLAQLFGLSRSESRLALALSRGMKIAQAAESLGIRIATARKCSKQIYAKTGAGGQPDLVRIVMRSVLSLAPQD